jgi:hypothetical protein
MQYAAWFELLTDDVVYCMPVRVTAVKTVDETTCRPCTTSPRTGGRCARVDRLLTRHADEDPQSRAPPRHQRPTFTTHDADTLAVESALRCFPPATPTRHPPAGRRPAAATAPACELARREIQADEAVLRTQNLAVFL